MNSRVWFKSISLENVRSFGTKQTINFTDKEGNAARWNVILGDNGTGKTTVLKGLCLTIFEKFRYPQFKVDLDSFFRSTDSSDGPDISSVFFDHTRAYTASFAGMPIPWTFGKISILPATEINDKPVNELREGEVAPSLFAYGAARRISNTAITRENESQIISLFNENYDLINAEEWLIQADYLNLKLKDKFHEKKYNTVYTLIETLFRGEAPGGIMFDTSSGTPQVKLCTHYGAIPLHELSLGYKTIIAWMVDFAKGLFDRHPNSENPLAEPAVCLVDEIDLHLHPKFQRTIIKFLTDTFPNTQFIVTAHSPLIVQSAEDANIILLKREGDETHVADGIDVHSWRIDQILSSDLFGGIGSRAPKIEEKMARRRVLLRKDERTPEEIQELDTLEKELNELPVMETREALKAIDIISKAVITEE